eukprot:2216423-Rhodomonas_salina.1
MPGRGSEGVYANVLDYLDDSPVTWHITEVPPPANAHCLLADPLHKPCQLPFASFCRCLSSCSSVWLLLTMASMASSSRLLLPAAATRCAPASGPHRVPERVAWRCYQHLLSASQM